jgi:hypothetical protein
LYLAIRPERLAEPVLSGGPDPAVKRPSVTGLSDDRGGASGVKEELAELGIDMLITSIYQEFHIFDDSEDVPALREPLRCNLGAVAVVNAVVPTLEDRG